MFWAVGPAVLVQKLEYRDSGEVLLASNDLLLSAPLGPEGQGGQIQAGASCGRNNRLVSGAVLQFSQAGFILRRENWLSTRGVSTPLLYLSRLAGFCRGHKCPCENRSAAPAAAPCIVHWTRSPPLPSGLPTHPQRPGGVPLDPNAEGRSGRLAEKALYCAIEEMRIAFSGRPPPAAPISYARPAGAPALSGPAGHLPRNVGGRSLQVTFWLSRVRESWRAKRD